MSLEERLESGLPSAWRPDQDDPDLLIGEIIAIEIGSSDYGKYPILVLRGDSGREKAIHGFHSVLQNELLKKRPQIGERIGVKFLGEVAGQGGRTYKGYRVEIERDGGSTFDWNAIGGTPAEDSISRVVYDEVQAQPETVTVPAGAGDDDIPF